MALYRCNGSVSEYRHEEYQAADTTDRTISLTGDFTKIAVITGLSSNKIFIDNTEITKTTGENSSGVGIYYVEKTGSFHNPVIKLQHTDALYATNFFVTAI